MRINNKELIKWLKILGAKKFIDLHTTNKIYLTENQLDQVIEFREKGEKRNGK